MYMKWIIDIIRIEQEEVKLPCIIEKRIYNLNLVLKKCKD